MNAPRDLGPDFRSWLDDVPPMPPELPRRTLDMTRHTRQRRRWIWFLPGPTPTAGADGHGEPAQPIPTIQRNGGTRSMFSATKLFAMAASVALLGAASLAVPLGQQQDQVNPAAEAPVVDRITSFTGEIEVLGKDQMGRPEEYEWGFGRSGEQWTTRLTTTDSRYSGISTGMHSYQQLEAGGPFVRVHLSRVFGPDEDGTWLSTGHGYLDPETTAITYVTQSIGEGAYEGLSVIDICEQVYGASTLDCHGIIFEGAWPALPGDAPGEVPAAYLEP